MFRGSFAFMCLGTETSCRGQNIPYGVLYLLGTIHTIIIETARIAWRAMVGRGDIAAAGYGQPGDIVAAAGD